MIDETRAHRLLVTRRARRRAVAVGALAGVLVGGCSLLGLYDDEGCCRFAPHGPPVRNDAGVPMIIYDSHGQRAGTVLPTPSGGATIYTPSGARAGSLR